jgi:hypothetical protein
MIKSEVPLAQWLTMNVFEVPAGFGGEITRKPSAAILAWNLDQNAVFPVVQAWETMMKDIALADGWGLFKRITNKQGNARTHEEVAKISREILLEVNARQFGHNRPTRPEIKKFVDELTEQYGNLHDMQNGHVEGIHGDNKIEHYMHQKWDDAKILELVSTPGGRKGVVDLFRQGYLQTGMDITKASALAEAMVSQKVSASKRTGGNLRLDETSVEGRLANPVELRAAMKANGVPQKQIDEIMDELAGPKGAERPGYAETRAVVDLNAQATVNGKTMSVVDLMDQDVPQTYVRYSKEATARTAISQSTGGLLDSDKAMQEMLDAMAEQAVAMGRPVNVRDSENALRIMMGRNYAGQLPMDFRRARDAVALAGMGGLGESQLAEFGLAINRGTAGLVGVAQTAKSRHARTKQMFGIRLTEAEATNRKYLLELQEMSALREEMYLFDRRNVHFDAQNENTNALSKIVDTATGGKFRPLLQHLQTRYTGYGAIRAWEDQIAMTSLAHDLAKHYRGDKAFTSPERLRDLGIDVDDKRWRDLFAKADFNEDGTIASLNSNEWSQLDRNEFGIILNRYASQQVQKSFNDSRREATGASPKVRRQGSSIGHEPERSLVSRQPCYPCVQRNGSTTWNRA